MTKGSHKCHHYLLISFLTNRIGSKVQIDAKPRSLKHTLTVEFWMAFPWACCISVYNIDVKKQNNATENFVENFVPEGWWLATMCILCNCYHWRNSSSRMEIVRKDWMENWPLHCYVIYFNSTLSYNGKNSGNPSQTTFSGQVNKISGNSFIIVSRTNPQISSISQFYTNWG